MTVSLHSLHAEEALVASLLTMAGHAYITPALDTYEDDDLTYPQTKALSRAIRAVHEGEGDVSTVSVIHWLWEGLDEVQGQGSAGLMVGEAYIMDLIARFSDDSASCFPWKNALVVHDLAERRRAASRAQIEIHRAYGGMNGKGGQWWQT